MTKEEKREKKANKLLDKIRKYKKEQ